MPQEHGWFYHFVRMGTGERLWQANSHLFDTALPPWRCPDRAPVFRNDAEIYRHAKTIYERIDFPWMLNNSPRCGRWAGIQPSLKARWRHYSRTHNTLLWLWITNTSISVDSWRAWEATGSTTSSTRISALRRSSLISTQQAWVDYRHRREVKAARVNYFENSITAHTCTSPVLHRFVQRVSAYSENVGA